MQLSGWEAFTHGLTHWGLPHLDLAMRAFRAVSAAMLVVLAGPVGASTYGWLQQEAEFLQCRSTMQELSLIVRTLPAKASAKRRPMQLRLDAQRGTVQVASLYGGAQPYDAIERTLWLPRGLEILEVPETLTITPSAGLVPASFLLSAPSHNTLFRLTVSHRLVRLDEEPLL